MRIGIDGRMYRSSVAGIGRYSQNLIKNLLEIDKENQYVLFMTLKDKREFENWQIENSLPLGIKIKNCELKIVEADIPHFSLAEQTKLPKILEKENLDLMHFLNFNYPVRYKGKFIVTIHDLTLFFYPETARKTNFIKYAAFRYVIKKACQNAAKIVAVSESTKQDIIKKFQIPRLRRGCGGQANDKIQIIYEAADDKIFDVTKDMTDRLQKKYNLTEPIILYVGQFRQHKNIEGLIRTFRKLEEKIPCQLVLLGGKKEDLTLDKSYQTGDIIMPGFVSDDELAAWYKMASVFVFPSFYEGFGLPGLEAMAAGIPVVSSNKAALPEIYQDAALYFNPFDISDMAGKIKLVLTDNNMRKRLIENGRVVSKLYSWRKTASDTLKVYQEIRNSKQMNA